jgi:hypothetical protein
MVKVMNFLHAWKNLLKRTSIDKNWYIKILLFNSQLCDNSKEYFLHGKRILASGVPSGFLPHNHTFSLAFLAN